MAKPSSIPFDPTDKNIPGKTREKAESATVYFSGNYVSVAPKRETIENVRHFSFGNGKKLRRFVTEDRAGERSRRKRVTAVASARFFRAAVSSCVASALGHAGTR